MLVCRRMKDHGWMVLLEHFPETVDIAHITNLHDALYVIVFAHNLVLK